jgi:hypothetical protein
MARYLIEGNEWYPVYAIAEDEIARQWCMGAADLTDDEVADFKRAVTEFKKWQAIIREKMNAPAVSYIKGETRDEWLVRIKCSPQSPGAVAAPAGSSRPADR